MSKNIKTILILFLVLVSSALFSQKYPVKEARAVWVGTVTQLDWPSSSNANLQKSGLVNIIQGMKSANYNTVMFQVRSRGDLMYPSAIEPWAAALSNSSGIIYGTDPGYDPLQFAIDECHKRGMELHAWWNVFYVVSKGTPPTQYAGPPHVAIAHPDWMISDGSHLFLNPGIPEVRTYLVNLAMEMVRKYDIDGIHFDYIRYTENSFNDDAAYQQYGNGQNKSDWRRENINKFVRILYDSIMAIKPMVKVGSAVIGVYNSGIPGVGGALYGYSSVYQDSKQWLKEGKHDYIAPMIYWALDSKWPYHLILQDWLKGSSSRHVYGGVGASQSPVYPQIGLIVDTTRYFEAQGNVFFSYKDISPNSFSATSLRYSYPANIPPMPWKDNIPPMPPKNLKISKYFTTIYDLQWESQGIASDGDSVKYYNIYRSTTPEIDFTNGKNLYKITVDNKTTYRELFNSEPTQNYYYAVTALDKGNVESAPSNIVSIIITGVEKQKQPAFILNQNYPNPFNPTTNISYSIPERGIVSIKVFNTLGQEVKNMVHEEKEAGFYNVEFHSENLNSGVYYYRINFISKSNNSFTDIKKMILLR